MEQETQKKTALDWLGNLHYQICNGGMAQACYNRYVDDVIEAYGSFDEWVDALTKELAGKENADKVIEAAKFIANGVKAISMTKNCPDCDGAGYTTYEEENEDGETESHEETCCECGGSGVLDVDKYCDVDLDNGFYHYPWDSEYYALVDKDNVGDLIDDLTHQTHTHSIVLDAIKSAK
jgi:ribosomal protein L12E/L44/L45/RPP1/RPP2